MNRIKRQLPLFPHSIFFFFWLIDQSKALWKISIPTAADDLDNTVNYVWLVTDANVFAPWPG